MLKQHITRAILTPRPCLIRGFSIFVKISFTGYYSLAFRGLSVKEGSTTMLGDISVNLFLPSGLYYHVSAEHRSTSDMIGCWKEIFFICFHAENC